MGPDGYEAWACFINPHTTLADVDALVDHVITIGDELTGGQAG